MKLTNKQYTLIIIISAILLISYVSFATYRNHKIELQKRDLQIEALEKQKSQIEILSANADKFRKLSNNNIKEIENLQIEYELNTLTFRCYQNQVLRLTENEVVNNEFCNKKENLEQYKVKK